MFKNFISVNYLFASLIPDLLFLFIVILLFIVYFIYLGTDAFENPLEMGTLKQAKTFKKQCKISMI